MNLIRRCGLTTPRKHGFKTDYETPFYSEDSPDRLYLWGKESVALDWAIDQVLAALRFPRELISDSELVDDPGFPGRRQRTHPSYYADATVSASSLEGCEEAKWSNRLGRMVAISWIPLQKVTRPTRRIDLR